MLGFKHLRNKVIIVVIVAVIAAVIVIFSKI